MYANLDEKFLRKTTEKAREESVASIGDDGKDDLMYPDLNDKIEEFNIAENEIELSVSNELGFFSIRIPLDSDDLEQMLSIVIKKMNKIKTMLESMK